MPQQLFSDLQSIQRSDYRQLNAQPAQPYRIAIVHPSAGVNWSGGAENFAVELTHRLSADFAVEFLAGGPCAPGYHPAGGIPRTKARQFLNHPLVAKVLPAIATYPDIVIEHLTSFLPCALHLLRHPVDLIFPCNDYGGLAMAAFVRALKGTPILYTEHLGLVGQGKSLARNLRFHPDQLVVFSEKIANFAQTLNPHQSVAIIPNGVDTRRFTPHGNSLSLNLKGSVVLCVATLKRNGQKRVELAMQAIARLPQASLLLCGDGADRAYFQALGESMLGADRFALITCSSEQMPSVYRSADVFTLPSLDEGFGLSYLEAMASGLPVVAPDDEMRRYVVGDAGIFCDVTNIETYAAAIATTLKGDWQLPAQLSAARFSWDLVAKSYRDLILTMLQSPKYRPHFE